MVLVVGYALTKLMLFIKNNPAPSMDAAQWLKRLFGKQ
jgi:hypothetical protein